MPNNSVACQGTLQIERAELRMKQQWYELVKAEQEGQPLCVLEQMYTDYLLLAEIYNAYIETHQSTSQSSKERVAGQRAAPATRSLVLWQRKIDPPAKAG